MSFRERVRTWLGIDARVRDILRAELAGRPDPEPSLQAMSERIDALEKKLKMTMGSVQASSTQLMSLHDAVDKARAQAAQATQQATTARATAEAVAEGLEALESRVAAPTATASKPAKRSPKPKSP